MPTLDTTKKPVGDDWHPAYLVYQLRLRGLSLRKLARLRGYAPGSATRAIQSPWPKMERIIADALGITPQEIWPSRYHADGTPKKGRGICKPKNSTPDNGGNIEIGGGNGHGAHTRHPHS